MKSCATARACVAVFVSAAFLWMLVWRFATAAFERPLRRKSDRARMRSDVRDLRQLQLLRPRALVERTSSGCAVFEDTGTAFVLGAIAFSWRAHFRARAA